MRTSIIKRFRFEAAHRLPFVPADHKCARLHGHSFNVTVHVTGPVDPKMGWVTDFADVTAAWQPLHDLLDHRYLNDVPGLENPTSENLAKLIMERFATPVGVLTRVEVHETCTSGCVIERDA